jgi:hypothetical protein
MVPLYKIDPSDNCIESTTIDRAIIVALEEECGTGLSERMLHIKHPVLQID